MAGVVLALWASSSVATAAPKNSTWLELLGRAHSHNDYAQSRPLFDALEQGFTSVEADVWLSGGKPMISHLGWFFKGSLEEMYLEPLQKIVREKGSVYGDGRPFYLWVELKENNLELRESLHQLLNRYPMLTEYTEKAVHPGPVTVILTGDVEAKRKFIEEHPIRRACRDADDFSDNDPPADNKWRWYAIAWDTWMLAPNALSKLVTKIHAKGKRVRIYAVPQFEDIWRSALDAQVDQLSVDDLPWMTRFLKAFSHGAGRSPDLPNARAPASAISRQPARDSKN